jgi:plastocyanin
MDQAQAVLASTRPPANQVVVGIDEDDVEYLRFLPEDLSIGVGDTVTWNARAGEAPHTVSFLSGAEAPEFVLPEPQAAGSPNLVFNPEVLAPSGGDTYSGSGFFNSGLLLGRDGPPDGPMSYALKFDTPGTFDYICLVHGPIMVGTITVSAGLPSVGGFAPTPLMGVFAGLIGLGMVAGGGLLVARRGRST